MITTCAAAARIEALPAAADVHRAACCLPRAATAHASPASSQTAGSGSPRKRWLAPGAERSSGPAGVGHVQLSRPSERCMQAPGAASMHCTGCPATLLYLQDERHDNREEEDQLVARLDQEDRAVTVGVGGKRASGRRAQHWMGRQQTDGWPAGAEQAQHTAAERTAQKYDRA